MAMKNVNGSIWCCQAVDIKDGMPIAYQRPFNKIKARYNSEGHLCIGGFAIISTVTVLSSTTRNSDCVMDRNRTLDVAIYLIHKGADTDQALRIKQYSIDTAKLPRQKFLNLPDLIEFTQIIEAKDIVFPMGYGEYLLMMMTKDSKNKTWGVQTFMQLGIMKADSDNDERDAPQKLPESEPNQ